MFGRIRRATKSTFLAIAIGAVAVTASAQVSAPASSWPLLGQFDKTLMGIYKPDPMELAPNSIQFGMPHKTMIMMAHLRDQRGKVHQVSVLMGRFTADPVAWTPLKMYISSPKGLIADPRLPKDWGKTPLDWVNVPGVGNRLTSEMHDITLGGKEASWKTKDGSLQLTGTVETPGQAVWPSWRRENGATRSFLYTTAHYRVAGTLLGEPVTGVIILDNAYTQDTYAEFFGDLEGAWSAFWNEYDDGTMESGYFICGRGPFHGAIVTNEKGEVPILQNEVSMEYSPQRDDPLYPAQILFTLPGGDSWEVVATKTDTNMDRSEAMPGFATIMGKTQRVGEKRTLIRWWSMTEFAAGRLCKAATLK